MNSTSAHLPWPRVRRLGLGLLLLVVPACGLSDYEKRMVDSQEREKRFREEEKYLDKPIDIPMREVPAEKGKQAQKKRVANAFFRPPKGIGSKPKPEPRNGLMWQYPASSRSSDFSYVEMGFPEKDDKNFATQVVNSYQAAEQPKQTSRQFLPAGQETPMVFDTWEFTDGQFAYSINILRSQPIAVVYIYGKGRAPDLVRKSIEVSLQSLAVGGQVGAAQQRFSQATPWQLEGKPGS